MNIPGKNSPGARDFRFSEPEIKRFRELIIKNLGFFYPSGKRFQVERALKNRLETKGILSVKEYFDLLQSTSIHDPEWRALSNELSIRETSFFRNTPQFGVLKDFVVPRLIQEKGKGGVRIWSAGCSTGQEPYSIAMVLANALPNIGSWEISILATDISTAALQHAEKGQYNRRAVQSIRTNDKEQFFVPRGEDWVISDSIRKMVTFAHHNLTNEPFTHPGMQNLDVIFCRNVTIYFDLETTRMVNHKFYDCLKEGGVLFIGHSETLWKISDRFKTVEFARTFIYQKGETAGTEADHAFSGFQQLAYETRAGEIRSPVEFNPGTTKDMEAVFKAAVEAVRGKEYDKAVSLFRGFRAGDPRYLEAKMDMAIILANQAKYDDAISALEEVIKHDNLHEWAYYHLGVLYNRKGDSRKACEMLSKALYVNPGNIVASYHQAEIFVREKDFRMAQKCFKNTLKSLDQVPEDYIIPYSGDLTANLLSLACHRQMEFIDKAVS